MHVECDDPIRSDPQPRENSEFVGQLKIDTYKLHFRRRRRVADQFRWHLHLDRRKPEKGKKKSASAAVFKGERERLIQAKAKKSRMHEYTVCSVSSDEENELGSELLPVDHPLARLCHRDKNRIESSRIWLGKLSCFEAEEEYGIAGGTT